MAVAFQLAWHVAGQPVKTPLDYATEAQPLYSAAALTTSVILAWVTGYYAFQNRRMVVEMVAQRKQSVRPHLVLELYWVGALNVDIRLRNVGQGPAMDVNARLEFVPLGGGDPVVRLFEVSVLEVGRYHDFFPPNNATAENLANNYESVRLSGQTTDVYGDPISVADAVTDLRSWWQHASQAQVGLNRPVEQLQVEALREIGNQLERLSTDLRRATAEKSRREGGSTTERLLNTTRRLLAAWHRT